MRNLKVGQTLIIGSSYKISKSKIHGQGLFAVKDIKKGQKIGDIQLKKNAEKTKYSWWDEPTQGFYYDVEGDLKYLNHSEKPNCILKSRSIYADRDIKKGEELTYNYKG